MGDFYCALGLYKNSVMRKLFETSPAIDFKGIMMLNEIYQSFNDLLFFLTERHLLQPVQEAQIPSDQER